MRDFKFPLYQQKGGLNLKTHTNQFKEEIGLNGRQLDSKITYQLDGVVQTLTSEQLNSITPTFQGAILKSVMKELDLDSNIDIPLGTSINYKFGVLVNNAYEYLDFGNYVVYSSEKQEDTSSYKIICYDKMLNSMKQNEDLGITYPISVRDYLKALCTKIGLEFKNQDETFANYDKMINEELYVGQDYTYRDILDELAQVTASTICLDKNDKVEIRYISNTAVDTIDENFLKDINVNFGEKYGPVNSIVLSRSGESDNVYLRDEESVQANGLCELKIVDNQIMNWNDRSNYLPEILEKLDGLEYYINDFVSTGIAYLDLCDRYNVKIGDNTYSCVMLNDELEVTQGLVENIHTDMPEETETDYTKADKTDRKINSAYIIADKQGKKIEEVVNSVSTLNTTVNNNYQEIQKKFDGYTPIEKTVELETSVVRLQTDTYTKTQIDTKLTDGSVTKVLSTSGTFDADGLTIEQSNAKTKGNFNASGLKIIDNTSSIGETLLFAGYDESRKETVVETANINVSHYLVIGTNSRLEDYEDGTGVFDI